MMNLDPTVGADGLRNFFGVVLVAVGALLPIVNPLDGAPFFLAATSELTPGQRHRLAKLVAIDSFALLIGSVLIGAYVLDFLGLSISSVQIGGGLVVCGIGWSLLNAPPPTAPVAGSAAAGVALADLSQRAFYPLTMPLTVGPGSVSVAITLGANPEHSARALAVTALAHLLGVAVVALTVYLCYRYADRIVTRMGPVGASVVMRLAAFLLLCIGVQICWNGIHAMLASVFPGAAR